jgi:hypothetical protein
MLLNQHLHFTSHFLHVLLFWSLLPMVYMAPNTKKMEEELSYPNIHHIVTDLNMLFSAES